MNRIAIIGGGPGGLMLGLLLQQRGYQFTIFEKSNGQNHQSQGGSLDIHGDTGQIPLKEAGLIEEFNKLARFEGKIQRLSMQLVKYIMKTMQMVKVIDLKLIVECYVI